MNRPADTTPISTTDLSPAVAARVDQIWSMAYQARTKDDLKRLYAKWATTYDEDHEAIGFFGHHRTADVLARHLTRPDVARVLDAGAGTGAGGEALREVGFQEIHALDLSSEMLEVARAKGVYSELGVADLSLPVDKYRAGAFDAAVLVGVFSYGQAPAAALDEVLRLVRRGGLITFTMRSDFYEEDAMGFRTHMHQLEELGAWTLVERTEPAPYLPGKDPDATFSVWCYRVTGAVLPPPGDAFEDAAREAFDPDSDVVHFDHAWIWDSTASRLYERYTRSDEYYLTDCEEEILRDHAKEIWEDESLLIELGCGSARKISHVLAVCAEASAAPVRYMPIDVSHGALAATRAEIGRRYGARVRVEPRQGMFEDVLSAIPKSPKKLLFFLGSSLGNLESLEETVAFLRSIRDRMGHEDRLIVGVDLDKDSSVLDAAYNQNEACRKFFVHMIRRVNRHLGADFDPRAFDLASTYVEEAEYEGIGTRRMNLRVAPRSAQSSWIRALGEEVRLEPGHPIQVGISRKFTPAALRRLAAVAGMRLRKQWLDRRGWFSLNEIVPEHAPA